MRSAQHLVVLLSLLLAVATLVHSEEQLNPVVDGGKETTTNSASGADEEVQDAPSTINGSNEGGIVAIHVDAVGGKEQLRPTLRGLSYLASSFLPREYKFIEIVSATREVVAGVRYELIASAEDEANAQKHICRLVILEKPWITTEYGEKYRALEHSNCTTNGDSMPPSVEVVTRVNPAFDANLRANQELTPQQMEEIEQQVIVEKVEVLEITSPVSVSASDVQKTTAIPDGIISTSEGLSDAAKAAIDDLFGYAAAVPRKQQTTVVEQATKPVMNEETIVPIRIVSDRAESNTIGTPTTTTIAPLDQQVQSTFEEVFKTHQEIQKALDEVIANGGGRDEQLKYRPVFDSLLQKVKASIDNYYRATNGGDANVDTAAFVVRDNIHFTPARGVTTGRPASSTQSSGERSSGESKEDHQQQQQQQQNQASPEANFQRKADALTVTFVVDSDDEDDGQQVYTKEQLIRELNADAGMQHVMKRSMPPITLSRAPLEKFNAQTSESNRVVEAAKDTSTAQMNSSSAVSLDDSKDALVKQLDVDEGQRRDKRDFSGGFAGGSYNGFSGGSFEEGSYSGGGYYGKGYYVGGYSNPYRREGNHRYRHSPYGYYGYYRGKRTVPSEDVPVEVESNIPTNQQEAVVLEAFTSKTEPTVSSSSVPAVDGSTPPSSTQVIFQAPKIESVIMKFGEPDSEEDDTEDILTKEQLAKRLNTDDELRRDKRGYLSSIDHSTGSQPGGYYGGYYQRPSYYNRPQPDYFGQYRGKRSNTVSTDRDSATIDLNDMARESSIKAIAQDAIMRLDQMDTDAYQRMLLEVLDARKLSERVDKMRAKYVLTVLTANSHCAEEESIDSESCRGLLMPDTTKQCTLEVHVIKSNDDDSQQVQLMKSKCQKQSPNHIGRLVGGATPVDLAEPEHKERIRLGLVGYENGKHSNFEILQGTVQLVAGTIHRYKIALKNDKEQDYGTCEVKIFTPLPTATEKQPEYNFDCHDDEETPHTDHHRRRRSEEVAPPKKLNKVRKIGGTQELTPEEYGREEHEARIRTGLRQLSALANANGVERKVKIVSASQQLVAGKSYTYRLTFPDDEDKRVCKLTVWEKPWLKEKTPEEAFKATFDCEESVKRTKRSGCVGCPSTMPAEEYGNSEHQERINAILSFHGVTRDSSLKVINATSQVVAGMKYTYYVEHNNAICKLSSWERLWLAKTDPKEAYKYSYECGKQGATRKRRSVPGGIRSLTQQELSDMEHVQRVDKILVTNGGLKESSARIVSGTVQIVSGKLYKYAVEFDVADGGIKLCKLSSWERPWLEEKDPTQAFKYTVSCPDKQAPSPSRKRRHAKKVGGSNDLTAEELKDKSHVERIKAGMVSYNTERSKAYNEFEILAGTTQQVAGSLYKYTFRVTSEPDTVCKISIWERVWLESQDQRKYNVKCTGDDDTEQQPDAKSQPETVTTATAKTVNRRSVRSLKIDDGEHVRQQFEKFKLHHRRQYANSLEHEMRFNIFRNNLFKIEQLNQFERGTAKYGVTKFADMTTAEYRTHTGLIVPKPHHSNHIRNPVARPEDVADAGELPESFDWRDHGAVTGVKDQGSCGSCWAFSAIGNIEGQHQIKTGRLESYSEQELIDCDKVDNGCQGGYMDDAFKAIEKLGGVELESDYPYRAKAQKSCQFNRTLIHARVKGAVDMPKNETFIAQYLVQNGPIAIGVNANAMQFYRGGISHPWHMLCSHNSIDHGVLIVGFGIKEYPMFNKTLPYWIIKNSWGQKWGEQGYYRIYRGDNSCGVSEMASSAVLA